MILVIVIFEEKVTDYDLWARNFAEVIDYRSGKYRLPTAWVGRHPEKIIAAALRPTDIFSAL
ncbi:hypothetical protein VI817_000210 [Penicillium citrinum]|nr:hypothetical protein VI817_000210 [Penicillium citrinum]